MSDALPLPPRPNVEQYKKLTREFQKACKSGDADAVRRWAETWAQSLARLAGSPDSAETRAEIGEDADRVQREWKSLEKSSDAVRQCTLAGAQLVVARCHGFASWPKFIHHIEEFVRGDSPVSDFESAADAIVLGDL